MNINQLQWFTFAYELKSFSKAATKAFVSRQALSTAIKSLETELGAPLFIRTFEGIEATELSEEILPCVKNILQQHNEITQIVTLSSNKAKKSIHMSLAHGVARALPNNFIQDISKSVKKELLDIDKHSGYRCIELLEKEEIDFAIIADAPELTDIQRILISEFDLYFAVPYKLIEKLKSNPEAILNNESIPLYLLGTEYPGTNRLIDSVKNIGIKNKINTQYLDYDLILLEVEKGFGCTIIPEPSINKNIEQFARLLKYPDSDIRWEICFCYRKGLKSTLESKIINSINKMRLR